MKGPNHSKWWRRNLAVKHKAISAGESIIICALRLLVRYFASQIFARPARESASVFVLTTKPQSCDRLCRRLSVRISANGWQSAPHCAGHQKEAACSRIASCQSVTNGRICLQHVRIMDDVVDANHSVAIDQVVAGRRDP